MIMMKKILKNNTEETIQILNSDIPSGESYDVPSNQWFKLLSSESVLTRLENGTVILNDGVEDLSYEKAILHMNRMNPFDFYSSLAVDKNGTDQNISTSWTAVTSSRVLWDLDGNYDSDNDEFVIPRDGIYLLDLQMKLKSLLDVSTVTLSIFKVGEESDEEWFVLDYKDTLQNVSQLTCAIEFDFYRGERYKIKIIMTGGLLVSGKIDGNDVYTAWGLTFQKPLFS